MSYALPIPTWCSACGTVALYRRDCTRVVQYLAKYPQFIVMTDPPYGIDLVCEGEGSGGVGRTAFKPVVGDTIKFDPRVLLRFTDVITWGCNHYCDRIPPQQGQWYFWDKVCRNGMGVRIAEGEYAWHKCGTKPRAFRHLWSGAYRASECGEKSIHPTQKPVKLFEWCLSLLKPGIVFDPYLGSGSSAVASILQGRAFVGVEIDADYFDKAVGRVELALAAQNDNLLRRRQARPVRLEFR